MSSHILDIAELYSMAGSSVQITSASRAADTASLSFRLDSVNGSAPWSFGDEVTLTENGKAVFHGYVTEEPTVTLDTSGMTCDVQLSNIVALLDATPYTEPQSFDGLLTNQSRLVSASAAIGQIVNAGMVLPGGDAAPDRAAINFGSVIMCPTGSGSQTCWSLVNSCLHWVPNAVTWYDPSQKLLTFRTAESGDALTLDLNAGEMRKGANVLFRFTGYESASFRARHDLTPPAVGLTWEGLNKERIFPSNGNLRQPWAFMFQIPERQGSPSNEEMTPAERRRTQKAAQPKMLVLGRQVPDGWKNTGNMKEEAPGAPELWRKFWSGFSAFRPLAKTNVSCLRFGVAVFEPDSVEDAFPPGELAEDTEQPENYEPFSDNTANIKIYSLYQGQFPASSKKRDNVNGLRFCKGRLRQYVWVDEKYTGELTEEEYLEFFSGSTQFTKISTDGQSQKKKARFALLELENIFINRRRKKYQTGTNELAEDDPNYLPETPDDDSNGDSGGSDEPTDSDYTAAAQDYYNATRKLYYDGSIALRGVTGYNPAQLNGANLNISGARAEWENMLTPVVQADWNPQYGTLTISTGSPEILTIDERIQRTLLGRQSNYGAGTSFANPPSIIREEDKEEEEGESESDFPMISPSISAKTTATKTGRPLNPFEMYKDGNAWYLNEGTLVAPGGKVIEFPVTDITEDVSKHPFAKFTVRAERKKGTNEWEAKIRHYTPKSQQ